jgi:chromosome segregation ATPase
MAYSSLAEHLKKFSIREKRSDAALQDYGAADHRAWTANPLERSILLRDIITRPSSQKNNQDGGDIDISGVSKNECLKKMGELQDELDKMHELYKEASQKIESLESVAKDNRKSQILLRDSEAKIKAQADMIDELKSSNSDDYEKLLRERDALKEQLKNAECLCEMRKKFKARADEADKLEEDVANLKRELEKCKKSSSPSGDKIKSNSSCCKCECLKIELEELKQRIEVEEKRSTDSMAERNFLRQKTRSIDVLEAELILYKNKYEECECKIRALKEVICKNESAERLNQQSMCQLKDAESRLMETECENDCLIVSVFILLKFILF